MERLRHLRDVAPADRQPDRILLGDGDVHEQLWIALNTDIFHHSEWIIGRRRE
jgi:hypothetical protein